MADLDVDELEILEAYERGESVSVATKEEIARIRAVARAAVVEDKRTTRLSAGDLSPSSKDRS